MLRGWYRGPFDQPYLQGHLFIPRFGMEATISFLVDTGADHTTLMPNDGTRLRVPFDQLGKPSGGTGAGGAFEYHEEPATLIFVEDTQDLRHYDIVLSIVTPKSGLEIVPSLLGRDILNKWYMHYAPQSNLLNFEVDGF